MLLMLVERPQRLLASVVRRLILGRRANGAPGLTGRRLGWLAALIALSAPAIAEPRAIDDPAAVVRAYYSAVSPDPGDPSRAARPASLPDLYVQELRAHIEEALPGVGPLGAALRRWGFQWLTTDVNTSPAESGRCRVQVRMLLTAPARLWELGVPTVRQTFWMDGRSGQWRLAGLGPFPVLGWALGDYRERPATPAERDALIRAFNEYVKASSSDDDEAIWAMTSEASRREAGRWDVLQGAHSRRILRVHGAVEVTDLVPYLLTARVRFLSAEVADAAGKTETGFGTVQFVPEGGSWRVHYRPRMWPGNLREVEFGGDTLSLERIGPQWPAMDGPGGPAPVRTVAAYYRALAPRPGAARTPADSDALEALFTAEARDVPARLKREDACLGRDLRDRGISWCFNDPRTDCWVAADLGGRCIVQARLALRGPGSLRVLGSGSIDQWFYLVRQGGKWLIDGMGPFPPLRWWASPDVGRRALSLTAEDRAALAEAFMAYADASKRGDGNALWELAANPSRDILGRDALLRLAQARRVLRVVAPPNTPVSIASDATYAEVTSPQVEVKEGSTPERTGPLALQFVRQGSGWKMRWMPDLGVDLPRLVPESPSPPG